MNYYSAFGDHAMKIARWYFSTTGVIKYVQTAVPMPYVTCALTERVARGWLRID